MKWRTVYAWHYKTAAKAVEERGVVEVGDKLLHQAIFFRNRKMMDKYEAVIKRWEGAVRDASGGECPEGDLALLQATVAGPGAPFPRHLISSSG
jgi:hypothetical protein